MTGARPAGPLSERDGGRALPIISTMPVAVRDTRTVEQAMSGQFAFCFPSTSLAQAARMMAQNRVTEMPVIVDQRSLGYLSYLDILQRYVKAQLGGRAADLVRTPL